MAFDPKVLPEALKSEIGKRFVRINVGSGFFVTNDGDVITALHVIKQADELLDKIQSTSKRLQVVIVKSRTDSQPEMEAGQITEQVDEDTDHDLALLKVHSTNGESVRPLNLRAARPADGDQIAVSGFPLQSDVLISNIGWVASAWPVTSEKLLIYPGQKVDIIDTEAYLADIRVNPGDSGAPVYLVRNGEVLGVCEAYLTAPVMYRTDHDDQIATSPDGHALTYNSGLGLVTPARYVLELLKRNHLTGVPH